MIEVLKLEFPGVPVGFSSHAVSPIVGAFAVLMGAVAVETHITLDRSMYGSDQAASLEKPGLEKLVDYCKMALEVKGDGMKRMTETEVRNSKKLRWFDHG
jgi:N-acetylneuraminate synthase